MFLKRGGGPQWNSSLRFTSLRDRVYVAELEFDRVIGHEANAECD